MKLCFVSNLFPNSDAPQRGMFNLQLVEELEKKIELRLLVPTPGKKDVRPASGSTRDITYLPVTHLPVIGRNMAGELHYKAMRKLPACFEDVDAILAPWLYPDGAAAARLGVELGKSVWIEVLGSDIFHLKNRNRRRQILTACESSEGVICVADHLKDALVDAGVPKNKIHVVPNGVDTSVFYPPDTRHPTPDTLPTVLWVGNLVHVKGPDRMLDVWERVQHSGIRYQVSGLTLVIIGDGPMRKSLERRARSMGLEDSISFIGSKSHTEIAERMRKARLLCLTSRSEGMPNVVLEALASGLPVVAAGVGGVPSMLEGCSPCAAVPEGEGFVDRFAAAVNKAAAQDVDRESISKAHSHRTWNVVAGEILDLMS